MIEINLYPMTRALCLALLALFASVSNGAAQGYVEINQSVIENGAGFPYTITEPGYYRFTGNVIKPASDSNNAIVIESDGVTLDLADFFLAGPGTCARNGFTGAVTCSGHVPGRGILAIAGNSDIVIKNGIVKGFFDGISTTATNILIDRLQISQNAFQGVSAVGDGTTVQQVSSQRNGSNGIVIQNNGTVTNCNATQNDDYGVMANFNSTVTRTFAIGNRLGGMSLNGTTSFSLNQVLDNFGTDPVFSGIDDGSNTCTNAGGAPVGC